MSYREKKIVDTSTSIPLGRLARPSEISSYIKKLIKASQYDYHESEAFEVKQVILNQPLNRGSVRGTFINNPNQEVDIVKPLMPNIVAVPVIGEHVVVIEYNGQHYYTSIINRKGSTNENSIPGASGDYIKNTKYGEKFKRKKVKPLEIGEGCILYEGRFGQSIHFDGHDNVPSIKIRTNIDESDGEFTTENIDEDDSSIYLTSDGLRGKSFEGQKIEGKNILIKSDSIFIKGDDIRLGSRVDNNLQPVVKGDELVEFLDTLLSKLQLVAPKITGPSSAAGVELTKVVSELKVQLKKKTILSNTVKTK
tara:strand:+ start:1013 stop:1936 length:924 start_codon:yes stop_codon:yes gene_type:complete